MIKANGLWFQKSTGTGIIKTSPETWLTSRLTKELKWRIRRQYPWSRYNSLSRSIAAHTNSLAILVGPALSSLVNNKTIFKIPYPHVTFVVFLRCYTTTVVRLPLLTDSGPSEYRIFRSPKVVHFWTNSLWDSLFLLRPKRFTIYWIGFYGHLAPLVTLLTWIHNLTVQSSFSNSATTFQFLNEHLKSIKNQPQMIIL